MISPTDGVVQLAHLKPQVVHLQVDKGGPAKPLRHNGFQHFLTTGPTGPTYLVGCKNKRECRKNRQRWAFLRTGETRWTSWTTSDKSTETVVPQRSFWSTLEQAKVGHWPQRWAKVDHLRGAQ